MASLARSNRTHSDSTPRPCEQLEERLLFSRALGLDVSSYQGSPTWSSVYSSGRTFAWAKASEGLTVNDSSFAYNAANAPDASVIIGAYHFAHYELGHSALDEANHFIAQAGALLKPGFLRPALDVEESTSMTATQLSQWVNDWCNDVLNATGCRPIVYTNPSTSTKLNSTVTQWALWSANYNGQSPTTGNPSPTTPWSTWNFWQYGDAGTVSGISGGVDVDVANGDITSYVIPTYLNKSSHFTVGQSVHVVNAPSGLKGWNTYASNGTFVTEANGKGATIEGNPVFINGYLRWPVKYNGDTVTRWSAEDYLAAGAGTAIAQAKPATATTTLSRPAAATAGANTSTSKKSSLFSTKSILA